MPANRSRTDNWRQCLAQVRARGGALEIALDTGMDALDEGSSKNLIWRVRVLDLTDREVVVEPPTALGKVLGLDAGTRLVGAMTIGQNRWMFHTEVVGTLAAGGESRLRLSLPEGMERCQRRSFYRISTARLTPPEVACWPLLDPSSVVAAEVANRALIRSMEPGVIGQPAEGVDPSLVLPEVGPRFSARLVNIGGGGAGLLIDRGDSAAVERVRLYWLNVDLTPQVPAPLGITARLVHTHVDSAQNIYAGMAFDFAFNPGHKEFVLEQISGYVKSVMASQCVRRAG